jgi:poly-gamma-glutamate synthesis protein (capsule biosynthesis protein)
MATGDIMLGDSPVCYGFGVYSIIRKHGAGFPFDHVRDTLQDADLVVGNLEAVASAFDPKHDSFKQIQYRAQPEAIRGLAEAGFRCVSMATNHTMQHGRSAVEETVDLLNSAGVTFCGLEIPERSIENRCEVEIKGHKFGLLNYNLRPRQYFIDPPLWKEPDNQTILHEVGELSKQVDSVIVCMHWGDEFIEYPSPKQVELGRGIIDAGARLVIGHHPHILQGIEEYGGGIIAYSLGNFVFDLWQEKLRRSMIFKVTFDTTGHMSAECIPVMINRRHQPEILTGEPRAVAIKHIEQLADQVTDDMAKMQAYHAEVERNTRRYRRDVNLFYLTHLHRYNPRLFFGNLFNSLRRRMGMK